jgi:hypothetical protein
MPKKGAESNKEKASTPDHADGLFVSIAKLAATGAVAGAATYTYSRQSIKSQLQKTNEALKAAIDGGPADTDNAQIQNALAIFYLNVQKLVGDQEPKINVTGPSGTGSKYVFGLADSSRQQV